MRLGRGAYGWSTPSGTIGVWPRYGLLVRWAAVEAAMLPRSNSWLKSDYHRIAARRGKKIAAVAVERNRLYSYLFARPGLLVSAAERLERRQEDQR